MVTIKEIAELAGVSTATVSRVVNNTGYVNEKTRKRVEDIIKTNNYVPSASAVNLSKRETNTIGVVVPELTNTFFGELLHGISEVMDKTEFTTFYFDSDNSMQKEERAVFTLEQQRARGLIITPARDSDRDRKLFKQLQRLNVPTIIVDRELPNSKWDGVFFENFQSGYCACETLIKAGHKKIGIITGDLNLKIARERYDGFMQAARDYDISIEDKYIYKGDFTIEGAYEQTVSMIRSGDIPQAILTSNNLTSFGFLKAINEYNLKIGKDIAVIGIDHIPELDILNYGFSCVARDTVEMGREAAKALLKSMENPEGKRQIIMIGYQLMLKGSEKTEG